MNAFPRGDAFIHATAMRTVSRIKRVLSAVKAAPKDVPCRLARLTIDQRSMAKMAATSRRRQANIVRARSSTRGRSGWRGGRGREKISGNC
jgi:hypothetical protein